MLQSQREVLKRDIKDYVRYCIEQELPVTELSSINKYIEQRTPVDFQFINVRENIEIGITFIIDTEARKIILRKDITPSTLYSFLKDKWHTSDYYIKFPFPLTADIDAFGTLYFETINGWKIDKNLI